MADEAVSKVGFARYIRFAETRKLTKLVGSRVTISTCPELVSGRNRVSREHIRQPQIDGVMDQWNGGFQT